MTSARPVTPGSDAQRIDEREGLVTQRGDYGLEFPGADNTVAQGRAPASDAACT